MKSGIVLALALAGCSKATPTPAPPVVSVAAVASPPSASAPASSAPPAERSGPPIVLDGKAFDPDTGAPWTAPSAAPAWPTPRGREATYGDEGSVGTAGDCRVVVGKTRIACLDNKSNVRWSLPPMKSVFDGGADMLSLPDGDALIYGWGMISDSGAELVRVRLGDGKVVFRVELAPAGVGHSKYRHDVFVRARGDRLDVVSVGSHAKWVEVLGATTGKSLARWSPKETQ